MAPSLANQKVLFSNFENDPEFSYLSAFLPFFFSSLIKTKSIASPFATRSFNSLKVVAQQPISFDLKNDGFMLVTRLVTN